MGIWLLIPIFLGFLAAELINYLADVLPHTLRLSRPFCQNPDCKATFLWKDYLFLHRCPNCGQGRSIRTFTVFILTEVISLYIWFSPPQTLGFAIGLLVLTYLFLVAVIDLEHRLILRPLSISGLILATLSGIYARGWLSTLIGGAVGFGIMFLLYLFGRLFTHWRAQQLGKANNAPSDNKSEEALGSGDVTLAAILGLLLGWPGIGLGLLLGILAGGVGGLLVILWMLARRCYQASTAIPYAPFFILSAVFLLFKA